MLHKGLFVVLAAIYTISLQAQDLWDGTTIASGFHGGTGTTSDPYQIRTGAQLKYFEQQVNLGNTFNGKTVCLMNSIDLGDQSIEIRNTFAGTFDGNGYFLEQIFQRYSVFKNVQGTIKHLGVRAGVYRFDRYPYYGKISLAEVLEADGLIENCYHELSKKFYSNNLPYLIDYHSFLVENNYGTIRNCYAKGNYSIYDSGGVWGGYLVGMLVETNYETGVIENCAASTYNNGFNARGQQQPLATTNKGTITNGTNTTESYFAAPSVCTVEFVDLTHGKTFAQRSVPCGQPIGTLPTSHDNWTLAKWTRYGKAVNETTTVDENWTLFALWEQVIHKQPTANDVSVKVDDEEHAQYQWYRYDEDDDRQYGDWTSTNHESSSSSSVVIEFSAKANQHLHFSYWVSCEEDYDEFKAYLNGKCILTASGEVSDDFDYLIEESGNYTLRLLYHKDDDSSAGSDMVKVTNITVPGGNSVALDCTLPTLSPSFLVDGNKYFCKISYSNTNAILMTDTVAYSSIAQTEPSDISKLDNVIYIEPMEARTGTQATISLKMKNTAEIRAFQFDLYLPEGVTAVKSAKGKIQGFLSVGRLPDEDEHTLSFSEQPDGAIRFLCGSEYDETFTGNDGEIATLLVNIADNIADGEYPVQLKGMKLTETDISKYCETALVQSKLTISTYVSGDINGDGVVDVSDYTGVANHIHNNTPAGFNAKAADVDESGGIDVSDYTGIANIIHTGSIYGNNSNARMMVRGPRKVNTDLSSKDNVIYVKPLAALAGSQTTISVKMKNTAEIRSFQFDLQLPDGVTVVKSAKGKIQGSLSASRLPEEDEHTLSFSEHEGNVIRFLCGSLSDETFTGNDGEIATLLVDVAANVEAEDHTVYLRNMKLSESDISKFYQTEELGTTLAVAPEGSARGDANGDKSVSVTDIAVVVNEILQITNSGGFLMYGADANGDGDITVTDIGVIVDKILGTKTSANSRKMEQEVEPQ